MASWRREPSLPGGRGEGGRGGSGCWSLVSMLIIVGGISRIDQSPVLEQLVRCLMKGWKSRLFDRSRWPTSDHRIAILCKCCSDIGLELCVTYQPTHRRRSQ